MPPFDLDTYAADVAAPISGADGSPAGASVAYDDDFLAVKAHIDAMQRLGGRIDPSRALTGAEEIYEPSDAPDFEFVAATGREILTDRSKDLRTACYVALALSRTHGVKGLTAGLQGIDALTTSYWKEMYPPPDRRRGRRRILAFLIEQLRDALPPDPSPADVEPEDAAGLPAAIRCLDALTDRWERLMGEASPSTPGLRKRLCALQTVAEAVTSSERDEPERDEPDASSSPNPSSPTPSSPQRPTSASSAPASVPAEPPSPAAPPADAPPGGTEPAGSDPPTEADLLRWAGRLLDEDATDPRSYRLLRLLRWDPISRTPPHEKTRTSLPAPAPSRREALLRLFDAGNDALFLEQAEAAFQQPPFHFWLDLQHLLCKALHRAGPSFRSAHDAVRTEILRLFHRFPALLDLRFSDDTPLARPETKRWITQQPAPSPPPGAPSDGTSTGASAAGDPTVVAPETDAVASALSAATDRLSRDGLAAALQHLQDASSDRSARTRFRVRLGMAALCMEDGAPRLAYPLLQSLAAEGRRRNLDRWNPDLLADVWTHLFRCCRDLADRPHSASEADDHRDAWIRAADAAREHVCALSPGRAVSLFSSREDPSTLLPGTLQGTEMINRIASPT